MTTLTSISSLSGENCVLLVIDMQNDYLHPEGAYFKAGLEVDRKIIGKISKLLAKFRAAGIGVIYTRNAYRPDMKDARAESTTRRMKVCVGGTWGAEIIDEIRPMAGDMVLEKRRYSAFYGTPLEIILRGLGVRTVVIAGIFTNACVNTTAREALMRDYRVLVPRDCTADIGERLTETALWSLDSLVKCTTTSRDLASAVGEG